MIGIILKDPLLNQLLSSKMIKKLPLFPAFFIGCMFCFWAHERLGLSTVVSSALVGLGGSFITSVKYPSLNICPAAIYSGSFAGMCSLELIGNQFNMMMVAILGSVIYFLLDSIFKGIGGKLGTVAFTSVAIFYLIQKGVF